MENKGSEFHVKLGGIKFSSEVEKKIEAGIQSLIMNELVGYKPNPDDSTGSAKPINHLGEPVIVIKPRPWPGFICVRAKLTDLNKIITELENSPGFQE